MTTTHDVPMPEPVVLNVDLDGGKVYGYTADQVRDTAIKYAAEMCKQSRINTQAAMQARINLATQRAEKAEAERDEAWSAYHDCQEAAIRLRCEADTVKLERDALAEKCESLSAALEAARKFVDPEKFAAHIKHLDTAIDAVGDQP